MIEFFIVHKDIISIISNFTTIFAFPIAFWTFFRWKKEQKFSKQLEYIMELEDRFEILMRDIKIEYKWFSDLDNNLIDVDEQTKKYKAQLNNFIKDEYEKYKTTQTIEQSFDKYSLALTRVKRFFCDIDKKCKILDYEYLKQINIDGIKINPKWENKENISDEARKHLKKITNIHEKGLSCIQKYYK